MVVEYGINLDGVRLPLAMLRRLRAHSPWDAPFTEATDQERVLLLYALAEPPGWPAPRRHGDRLPRRIPHESGQSPSQTSRRGKNPTSLGRTRPIPKVNTARALRARAWAWPGWPGPSGYPSRCRRRAVGIADHQDVSAAVGVGERGRYDPRAPASARICGLERYSDDLLVRHEPGEVAVVGIGMRRHGPVRRVVGERDPERAAFAIEFVHAAAHAWPAISRPRRPGAPGRPLNAERPLQDASNTSSTSPRCSDRVPPAPAMRHDRVVRGRTDPAGDADLVKPGRWCRPAMCPSTSTRS